MTSVRLMLRLTRGALTLDDCVSFKLEKDRFLPYTHLTGEWYCPKNATLSEITTVMFYLDSKVVHMGYPCGSTIEKRGDRTVLKVDSKGYSALLLANQCADGLVPNVDLAGLVRQSGISISGVTYQQGTPTVNYVNYYNGTSIWDGIVSYSLRAAGTYPYLYSYNMIRITPPEDEGTVELSGDRLIKRSNATDFSRIVSRIAMKPIDGEGDGYVYSNTAAARRSIVRCQELPFDREWIMDPVAGLEARANYSMRTLNCDRFTVLGYVPAELLSSLSAPSESFSGTVSAITVSGASRDGIVTEFRCDHDAYST